jgi:hypothetical protein
MFIIGKMLSSPHHNTTTLDPSNSSFSLDAILEYHNTIITQYLSPYESYSTVYASLEIVGWSD